MNAALLALLGGLGLFLMGMANLTDGLKALAGGRLAQALARFTRTPASGALTGLVTTAAVQSSSATTVVAVGFAGAGLLTFPQALGIVFGANLGSTLTGWLVALLGFKLDLDRVAPLLVFVGMALRFGLGVRWRSAGTALAGFGLLFTGLGILQDGVAGVDLWPSSERLPPGSLWGRALLVAMGLGMTLITQASSAGVATAIAALHAGQIDLAQAGALVVGMDVGTTVTALAASLGGSLAARRTGLAHVIFNLFTGLVAFLLLPPYVAAVERGWLPFAGDSGLALVAFHSGFNLLGVLVILPLTQPFARLVERVVPARDGSRVLDRALLRSPHAAVQTAAANLRQLLAQAFDHLALRTRGAQSASGEALSAALTALRRFLLELETDRDHGLWHERHVQLLEAIDQLERALRRAQPRLSDAEMERAGPEARPLAAARRDACACLAELARGLEPPDPALLRRLEALWSQQVEAEPALRTAVLRAAVENRIDDALVLGLMDEARRLRRVLYHAREALVRCGPWPSTSSA